MRAKLSSLPATPSATAIEASLPDCTMMPRNRSDSFTRLLSWANIDEPLDGPPPLRQAFSEIRNSLSRLSRPCRISLKITSTVMVLAMLAGTMSSSAFFSNRTVPES
jgi:hypothetical protein